MKIFLSLHHTEKMLRNDAKKTLSVVPVFNDPLPGLGFSVKLILCIVLYMRLYNIYTNL
jgi:hypothetical protein